MDCWKKHDSVSVMKSLHVGQKLWWVDREKQTEGYVLVAEIKGGTLWVLYNGKKHHRPISVIGKTLFLTPQLHKEVQGYKAQTDRGEVSTIPVKREYTTVYSRKKENVPNKTPIPKKEKIEQCFFDDPVKKEKSCDTCVLRKNGNCTSLKNQVCEDYRTLQKVRVEERNAYPQYGDATAFRKKDWKHFK